MTAVEFNRLFDLICDKVGSDYFSSSEKEDFINRAQYSVIDTLLFPPARNREKKDKDVFEYAYQNSMIQGLGQLRLYIEVPSDSATSVSYSAISGEILSQYSITASPYKVITLLLPSGNQSTPEFSAKFVGSKSGSSSIYSNLRFGKNTDARYATYSISGNPSRVIEWSAPIFSGQDVGIEMVRTPIPFSISGNITCEIDPIYHNEVLFRALQLAGIAIREGEFYEMTTIEQGKES
jgi:hypothetical protein